VDLFTYGIGARFRSGALKRIILRISRITLYDRFLANVILEEQSDEESRSRQGAEFISKNEMLHFVQHDQFLNNVIPSPFHDFLEMSFGGAKPSLSLRPVAELTDACQIKCEDQ